MKIIGFAMHACDARQMLFLVIFGDFAYNLPALQVVHFSHGTARQLNNATMRLQSTAGVTLVTSIGLKFSGFPRKKRLSPCFRSLTPPKPFRKIKSVGCNPPRLSCLSCNALLEQLFIGSHLKEIDMTTTPAYAMCVLKD